MKSRNNSFKAYDELSAILFIGPFLIGFIFFNLIPIISSIILSFVDYNKLGHLTLNFVGISNFARICGDEIALNGYMKSFLYSLTYVPGMIILSLLMAVLINKAFHFRTLSRTMIFMPYVSNVTAVAMVWSLLFDPFQGPVNGLLKAFGVANPPLWFGGINTSLFSTVIVSIWLNLAFQTIVFLAALQGVSKELYESAHMDGAGRWRQFLNITIPSISPVTFFLIITTTIGSFQNYAIVKLLTNGGPGASSRVISVNLYEEAFNFNRFSYASAQAMVLFVFILILTIVQWRGQKKWVHY
jgi:multiple sugar transport system permease protein